MEQEQKKEDIIPATDDFTKNEFKVLVEATKVQQQTENIHNRDLEEKTEMINQANDDVLERLAIGIDEFNEIKRTPQEVVEIEAVSAKLPESSVSSSIDSVVNQKNTSSETAENIVRPQVFFKDKIDNSNKHPWIPRITEKPNALKPLAISLEESEHGELYSHPYEFELENFTPSPNQLQKVTPITPKPLEETPLHEISTPEQLDELVDELQKHAEFAVDLQHHSYRTFMGITCLMQISTKDADYLIDTFTLRDKLCILNEVFTKPSVVKVFHDADSDVEWLQRDLSLYVVNMFDTHQAAKQLEYSELSLAYLLNRFCDIIPNKDFQLADWRIRPLNDELKLYARMDTHYLIYIYHMLKNELIEKDNGSDNILKSVIRQSTQICKKRYVKRILHEESHLDFYRKCKRTFDNSQMHALKELYHWRDGIARAEDESTEFVLPNHMLLQIAETIPSEMQDILACCNPIPPLVQSNLSELHRIILQARDQSAVKPILKEGARSIGSTFQFAKVNVDSPLYCPHDVSKSSEFQDDLPTLLDDRLKNEQDGDDKSVVSKTTDGAMKIEKEKAAAQTAANSAKAPEKISNDDRIAALHAHFVKVAKETPQIISDANEVEPSKPAEVATSQTLVAMGDSKERKRKQSQDAAIPTGNKQTLNKKPRPMSNKQKKRLEWREMNKQYKEMKQAQSESGSEFNDDSPMSNRQKKRLEYKKMIEQHKEMKEVTKSPTQSNNQKETKQMTKSPAQSKIPPPGSEFNDDSPMSNRRQKRLEWKEMNKQHKEIKQATKLSTQSNNQKEMKQITKSPAQSKIPPPSSEFNDDSPMSNRQKKRLEWKEMIKQHKEIRQVTKLPTQSNNQKEIKQITKSPAQSKILSLGSKFNDDSPMSNRQKKRLEWKEMNKQYKEMKQMTKSPAQSESGSEFNDDSPMSNRQKKRLEWKEMNKQHKEIKQLTKSLPQSNKQNPTNKQFKEGAAAGSNSKQVVRTQFKAKNKNIKFNRSMMYAQSKPYYFL